MEKAIFSNNKKLLAGIITMVLMVLFAAATSFAGTQGTGAGKGDDLESVWKDISSIISGTGGKIAALGIIGASVWNHEKIGMLYMFLGVIVGIMLPSLPTIVDNFSGTI